MVSILPSGRSNLDIIGEAIGQNLGRALPAATQQGFQRQMGLNAIDQLQNEIAQSGGDLSKLLPAIAKAYTLNPSLERSGIAEKFIPLAQRAQGAKEFPAGKLTAGGMPLKPQEEKIEGAQKEVPVSVSDLVAPRKSMVQNPQGTQDFQLPYGPEEIAKIRQDARALGYFPEMEERFVNDALEYNKIAQNRRDIEIQNFQQREAERKATLANQMDFEKYLATHAKEFGENPDELELALKASDKYQNESSFADRLAKVKQELRPYQAAKNALQKTLKRPLFGQTKEQRNLARPRAKFMVEMGQKPQLQLMIANGGNGEVEEADLLNPLPREFENKLSGFNRFIDPQEMVTSIDPDSPEYDKQLALGNRKLESQKNHMSDFLSKNIQSGTYDNPGTNLLLTRYHLMQKGLPWDAAGKIIDDAIEKGNLKLDPQQKIDYQKLGYPPLTGEDYLDTLLNNLLFPITGRQ